MCFQIHKLKFQTESTYVKTVPDGRCLCPAFCPFTRLSCVQVRSFLRSPDSRAFTSRLLCVHQNFVLSPDFRSFMSGRLSVHPTFLQSTSFRAFVFKLSCVCQTFVRLKCLLYVNVMNFVRPCPVVQAFNRLSFLHVQTFFRSTDFRAFIKFSSFHVQTFERLPDFPAFITPCAFIDFRAFNRYSSVHVQTFLRSYQDLQAFNRRSFLHFQTFTQFRSFNEFSCFHV